MTGDTDILERVNALKAAGEAFALATVVRTVSVTAAKAVAKAVIGGRSIPRASAAKRRSAARARTRPSGLSFPVRDRPAPSAHITFSL